MNVSRPSIEEIDKINNSGTLRGITFFCDKEKTTKKEEIKEENEEIKEIEEIDDVDSFEFDEEISVSNDDNIDDDMMMEIMDLTDSGILGKENDIIEDIAEKVKQLDQNNNMTGIAIYSRYADLCDQDDDKNKIIDINDKISELWWKDNKFMIEIIGMILINIIIGGGNSLINIITIDGVISSLIFYAKYIEIDEKVLYLPERRNTLDRYIYYILMGILIGVIDYVTWYKLSMVIWYLIYPLATPSFMEKIVKKYRYRIIRRKIYNYFDELMRKIICKQLCQILNLVFRDIFHLDNVKITVNDLIPHYDSFSYSVINEFVVTFIISCIFNHIDKGSARIPLAIYKNIYMKEQKYNNLIDDKEYVSKLILDKQWDKFLEVYTLNRMLRIIINDDRKDSVLSEHVSRALKTTIFRCNRIMFCWTIMSIFSSSTMGILTFLLFVNAKDEKMTKYITNIILWIIISLFSDEKILLLILCEIFSWLIGTNFFVEVCCDVYKLLRNIINSIGSLVNVDSFVVSMILFVCHNIAGPILNMIVLPLLVLISISRKVIKTEIQPVNETKKNIKINSSMDKDDPMIIIKNSVIDPIVEKSVTCKLLNLFVMIDKKDLNKQILVNSIVTILSLFSGFSMHHIIVLPILVQIFIDFSYNQAETLLSQNLEWF